MGPIVGWAPAVDAISCPAANKFEKPTKHDDEDHGGVARQRRAFGTAGRLSRNLNAQRKASQLSKGYDHRKEFSSVGRETPVANMPGINMTIAVYDGEGSSGPPKRF